MTRIALLCLLGACSAPHSPALVEADRAFAELSERYRVEQVEALAWAETPAEAWDESATVLDVWAPAWWALRAVYESGGGVAAYCAARALWAERGVLVPDMGCTVQRPCWMRPEDEVAP